MSGKPQIRAGQPARKRARKKPVPQQRVLEPEPEELSESWISDDAAMA